MVIQIDPLKIRKKRKNLFMTEEEAAILWEYAKKYDTRFQLFIAYALFRGLRSGEIAAINIYDFDDFNFKTVRVILEKSHEDVKMPLIEELGQLTKDYVAKNMHLLKDGYLFPYQGKNKFGHIGSNTARWMLSKLRKKIAINYPQFNECYYIIRKNKPEKRYRICLHSCRRFFETRLIDKNGQYKVDARRMVAHIMRYNKIATVDTYMDPYIVWKMEREVLNDTFDLLARNINQAAVVKEQKKLTEF